MINGEEEEVSRLVQNSFTKHVASYYSREGVDEFLRISSVESIRSRKTVGNEFIVCKHSSKLIGMIELRSPAHIHFLFVDPDYAGRGIGTNLVSAAKEYAGKAEVLTVNASPNSVEFYKKCGFCQKGGMKEAKGLTFYPMEAN